MINEPTLKEQFDYINSEIIHREGISNAISKVQSDEYTQAFERETAILKTIRERIKWDYLIEKSIAESIVVDPEEKIEIDDLISKEEFLKLSKSLECGAETKEIEMERLFKWATEMRSGSTIVDLLIEGTISIVGWQEDGTPALSVPPEFLEICLRDTPMIEESRC